MVTMGFTLVMLLGALWSPQPDRQESFPDPQQFLKRAEEHLTGNFFHQPDLRALQEYTWEMEGSQNNLDKRERLWSTDGVVRSRAFVDGDHLRVEKTLWMDGRVVKTLTESPAGLWATYYTVPTSVIKDLIWAITSFSLLGRERLNGRDSIVFSFRTESDFKERPPKMRFRSLLRSALSTEGKAWFDEEDHRLVKVEGRYYRGVEFTRGFITSSGARKGETFGWQLKKIDDAWLPDYMRKQYPVKGLWFKKGYRQLLERFTNFRKRPSNPQ